MKTEPSVPPKISRGMLMGSISVVSTFLISLALLTGLKTYRDNEFIAISLNISNSADYGTDDFIRPFPNVNLNILQDLVQDDDSGTPWVDRVGTAQANLLTPVPTITPPTGGTGTSESGEDIPTSTLVATPTPEMVASATIPSPTQSSTSTQSPTSSPSPTNTGTTQATFIPPSFTPTPTNRPNNATSTATSIAPTVPPTITQQPPSVTPPPPTTPPQPTSTQSPTSPPPTNTLPPPPPTNTPQPTKTPTATKPTPTTNPGITATATP